MEVFTVSSASPHPIVGEPLPSPAGWDQFCSDDRKILRQWCFGHKVERRLWIRATIIRGLFHLRQSVDETARHVGVVPRTVRKWFRRFLAEGVEGLYDRPRSGAPPRFSMEQRFEVVAIACERPKAFGLTEQPCWTIPSLTDIVNREIEGVHMSRSSVWRTLNGNRLKPHRSHYWQHSRDPRFKEIVNQIAELYTRPPVEGEVILCIDEKPGMQATERKNPTRLPLPGRRGRYEHEYIRHGTQTLLAAFNIHTGKVTACCGPTRKGDDLVAFMEQVAQEYRWAQRIIVVWDNLNIHYDGKDARWSDFNDRHAGKFEFVYTPKHASWINQVEIFFSIVARRCLRYGDFQSTTDLARKVIAFIHRWNTEEGHPFNWAFRGYSTQEEAAA